MALSFLKDFTVANLCQTLHSLQIPVRIVYEVIFESLIGVTIHMALIISGAGTIKI